MSTIYFPQIKSLEIENFSLYTKNLVKIEFDKRATCLMGANGIGKSTLLNCINFALTGCINDPTKKKIKSVNDFAEGNDYYKNYFDGRIDSKDKDNATIKITFLLNDKLFCVKRKFYPSNEVREFSLDGKIMNNYEEQIIANSNLKSFNQFVFIVIKLLTFDESRDCIFWNETGLTPLLFLCMGADSGLAENADRLAREIQRVNSNIRNMQWDITKQNQRLSTLIEEKNNTKTAKKTEPDNSYLTIDEMQISYNQICETLEERQEERRKFIQKYNSAEAKLSELSVEKLNLEQEYSVFYEKLFSHKDLNDHIIIKKLLNDGCPICGTKHSKLPCKIEQAIKDKECPLCGESLSTTEQYDNKKLIVKLEEIDKRLKEIKDKINSSTSQIKESMEQISELDKIIPTLNNQKLEMERNMYEAKGKLDLTSWDERIDTIKEFISESEKQKALLIERINELTKQYDEYYSDLQSAYKAMEIKFLPIFRKLAYEFTGLDLYMNLDSVMNEKRRLVKFTLRIEDSNRENEFELSESQRFFIDIAFRMALTSFVSDNKQCTMLIDTPEGSLDIAYETNAGNLFSEYINNGFNLIITANLNSSGLVQTLAKTTGNDKFGLINMLNWVNLSSVQIRHRELFDKAINNIKQGLK